MMSIHGESESHGAEGKLVAQMHLHTGPAESSPASDRFVGAARRAGAVLGTGVLNLADRIDERTGALNAIRQRPVAAIALAASAGFLVATLTGNRSQNWLLERARRQLRGVILSSISAALAHELRGLVDLDATLSRYLQTDFDGDDLSAEDFEFEDFDDERI